MERTVHNAAAQTVAAQTTHATVSADRVLTGVLMDMMENFVTKVKIIEVKQTFLAQTASEYIIYIFSYK